VASDGDELDVDVLAASLRADGADVEQYVEVLAEKLTGALPAEYGLDTGGVMDIQTKSGLFSPGGHLSVALSAYAGPWFLDRVYWTIAKATGKAAK